MSAPPFRHLMWGPGINQRQCEPSHLMIWRWCEWRDARLKEPSVITVILYNIVIIIVCYYYFKNRQRYINPKADYNVNWNNSKWTGS